MTEVKRNHLSPEQKVKQVKSVKIIEQLTAQISDEVSNLEGKSCKAAFDNSVMNLEKKCEQYGKEKLSLSPDEKRIMKEAGEKALKVFRGESSKEEVYEVPADEVKEPSSPEKIYEKKKGKR